MRDRRRLPKHPFRDSAIFYGVLAGIVVVVGALTSGDMVNAVAVALAFFVLATGYSWWRFRRRLEERGTGSR
jgi:membrane protein implicated in regulation of membrane protease activity